MRSVEICERKVGAGDVEDGEEALLTGEGMVGILLRRSAVDRNAWWEHCRPHTLMLKGRVSNSPTSISLRFRFFAWPARSPNAGTGTPADGDSGISSDILGLALSITW